MATLVHLEVGEDPPQGSSYILISCVPGLQGAEMVQGAKGLTLRIPPEDLEASVVRMMARAEETGASAVYIHRCP